MLDYPINASPSPSVAAVAPHDAWHSPVPYLFGGLAAMLGLIAFALLILACSYWRLSNYLEEAGDHSDGGDGTKQGEGESKPPPCFGEGFVVIMAGDNRPTFLATPISSRASSFGDNNSGGGNDAARAREGEGKGDAHGKATVSEPGGDRNPEP